MDKAPCLTIPATCVCILSAVVGITLGMTSSAIADGIPGVTFGDETGADPSQPITTPAEEDYTQAMLIGYAAAEQGDYQTALINFRRALEARSGDQYALAAIANMEAYIERQRQEALRRQRLIDLQAVVDQAVQARDWACAAASVDEMITLVPENSLDRSRFVAYRGELSALLDARADIENWSTVCPG
ncbi:MAG: hypothetical protein F6K42_22080 [Leptolyngbya sp. SIO1D8]|nr:hypothetical protein [Leptolyngbya sp. SIO1D8]